MNLRILFATGLALSLFFACNKEENYLTGGDVRLEFSVDTLRFDTVFTSVGSATRYFKVYNRNDRPVRIAQVSMEGSSNNFFRMNVDGEPGNTAENIEIPGNDSVYVFVEVTVDPDQPVSVSPFVVGDRIQFITNDNEQIIHLEAWGQNANYIPRLGATGEPSLLTCGNQEVTWDDPKPYVIYGALFIDSCALNIPAGARLHVHGGIAKNELFGTFNDGIIYVLKNGRIKVNGSPDNPVIIQGDRLEDPFQEEEGQWTGIVIGRESKGNVIDYATVKNSIFGIYVDSAASLLTRNSRFYNTASSGLFGFHSSITAENCLLYNNYNTAVQLVHGGDYRFTYCTLASYGVNAAALSMSNFFCYDDPTSCQVRGVNRLRATFKNSIIYGSRRDEISLADISGGSDPFLFGVKFENCIVKVDELLEQQDGLYADFFEDICTPCLQPDREDPLFVSVDEDDYHLDSLSVAIGLGEPLPEISVDLEDKTRDENNPDVGCYERTE